MWAGRQDWSTTDKNPYIFERSNAVVVAGTCENGIMKADAMGRVVAAITKGNSIAKFFGGMEFDVGKVGVATRVIEPETFGLE